MLLIGSHVSFNSSSQLLGSVKTAISYGANTFMFYTGAPQNTVRCKLDYDLTLEARNVMYENNIRLEDVVIHAPYIINLANNEKKENYRFAINFLKEEIKRASMLGITKLVLHPGSSVKLSKEDGINNIVNALNEVVEERQDVIILLETMAGKGSELCYNIDQLKEIIERVNYSAKIGVCVDTCHLNDAGYDISKFESYLDEFDKKIGINKIGCVHVNDTKNTIGSRKDRHENIGFGYIGFDNLIKVIYNKRLEGIPKILETPYVSIDYNKKDKSYPPYKFEIEMIKNKRFDEYLYDHIKEYYNE